jgi:hypothetical protein
LVFASLLAAARWLHAGRQPDKDPKQPSEAVMQMESPPARSRSELKNSSDDRSVIETEVTKSDPKSIRFGRYSTEPIHSIFDRMHKMALDGDVDAQFLLYEAVSYCDETYRAYFDRGNQRLSLDESLLWASTRPPVSMEDIRLAHWRCSTWKSADRSEYGGAEWWLQKATDAGLPEALAVTGKKLLLEAGRAQGDERKAAAKRAEGRKNLLAALNKANAAAIWTVGESLMMLGGASAVEHDQQLVWHLAACRQGYDCSAQADWVVTTCAHDSNCPPGQTGVELIQQSATNYPGDLAQAAARLAERLKRGNVSEEEFESLISSGY